MKKIFLDMYLDRNLGDDLFLHTILMRYPNHQFIIHRRSYKEFAQNYKNLKIDSLILKKILKRLNFVDGTRIFNKMAKKCDALIFLSGSYFMEDFVTEEIYQTRINLIKSFKNKNKPIYILGTNFGAYKTELFKKKHIELFKLCNDICFRDKYSYNLFSTLDNVRKANDVVLHLDIESSVFESEKIIGFSIINLKNRIDLNKYHDIYIRSIKKSIEVFIQKGYKCVLMSFCTNQGDKDAIEEVISLIGDDYKKSIEVFEYKNNLLEALDLISKFSGFIATRFHASILAIKFNIPLIPIIYNQKTKYVLDDLGLSYLSIDMDNLNLLYNEEYLNERFKVGNTVNYKSLNLQFEKLDNFLRE